MLIEILSMVQVTLYTGPLKVTVKLKISLSLITQGITGIFLVANMFRGV